MEKVIAFVFGFILYIGLIFFGAWGYATAWNMVMPDLYGLPTVTMLQAYAATFVVSVLTARSSKSDHPFFGMMGQGYARVTLALLVAYIIRHWFM